MKLKRYIAIPAITLVIITHFLYNQEIINAQVLDPNAPCETLKERLKRLEPEAPRNIDDPPWDNEVFPTKVYPIPEIIKKGNEIPLSLVYNDTNWKRQPYKSYWHSTISGGRWSYVPVRIHYAMHRLFTTYSTASIYYDFIHDLGIASESKQFVAKHTGPFDSISTVVMQAQVKKILTYGNQVVIIVKPQRNGLQVFDIPVSKIKPANVKENILFQLATEQGDEIDYSLINYIVLH